MNQITTGTLKEILEKQNKPTPICISTLTDTRSRKTNNPFSEILKLNKIQGFIGNYENMVNNKLEKEDKERDFTSQERKWGTHISTALIENKGEYYLSINVLNSGTPIFYGRRNGMLTQVNKEEISSFLPEHRKPMTQEKLEGEVVNRTYKLSSIKYIAINGEKYSILNQEESGIALAN